MDRDGQDQGAPPPSGFGRRGRREPTGSDHPSIQPGRVVGDFRLLRLLGSGGMGQVWEAEQLSLRRPVALKLLLTGQALSERQLATFRQEAMAGGKVRHPSLVAIHGYGEVDGLPYIAQELVGDGWTLADVLDEHRRTGDLPDGWYREIAEFFATAAEALQAVHDLGVIHRDLKPSNILIADDDRPMIADFGLAKVTGEQTLSRSGDVAGTYGYMSPEQLLAKRIGIDHQTDVFSLGATLYEALTLQRAFTGDTEHQISERVIYHDPPDPRAVRSRVPHDLAVICMKALEKRRGDRYGSMGELAAELRRWLRHEPIHARPPGVVARAGKWVRRHPVVSGVGGVLVVALAVISWLALVALENKEDAEGKAAALEESKNKLEASATDLLVANAALVAERAATQKALDAALRSSYSANFHAAAAAQAAGNHAEARRRLEACPPKHRGWEWDHLDLTLDQSLLTMRGHTDGVQAMAWNPSGTLLASASSDGTLRLWDATTGESVHELEGHTEGVAAVAWHPAGTLLASASGDGTLRLWDATTGESVHELEGHTAYVTALAWHPAGTLLASASGDGTLRLWDATTGESVHELEGHTDYVTSLAWHPAGTLLASASLDNTLRLWDATTGESVHELQGHADWVNALAWNPAGTLLASASDDNTLRLWDATTGESVHELQGHAEDVTALAWHPAGTLLASASWDNTLRLWDATTGESVHELKGHTAYVTALAWHPAGTLLASASGDNTLRLWDATTGESVHELEGHSEEVTAVAWNPLGTLMASASGNGTLRLWDATTGESVHELKGHTAYVTALAWHPAGTLLASASGDGTRRLWDATTGESVHELQGHAAWVTALAWHPAGTLLASASNDNTLRLWDATTGESVQELKGHTKYVTALGWNPSGTRLASASDDGTLRLWESKVSEALPVWRAMNKR